MNDASQWLEGLNEEQRKAAAHVEGPLLILAGAGSGKTTVLVARTGYLLASGACKAENLAVLTFTNKAARELIERVRRKLGAKAKGLWTGTFHSFGLSLLREDPEKVRLPKKFGIVDASDAAGILKEVLLNVRNTSKSDFKLEKLLSIMSQWRATGQTKAKSDDEYEVMVEVLLPKYLKQLELLGVADFDDLLLKPLEMLEKDPDLLARIQDKFRFVMVDEFQDTNLTQFRLLQKIVESHQNLAVVGDDDQSIYGWRGARVENILNFPKHFKTCNVIRLERNYRSSAPILNMANAVIQENTERHTKVLKPMAVVAQNAKPELFVLENEDFEAEEIRRQVNYFLEKGYKYKDIAVLYRSNGQSGLIEAELRQNQIPYVVTGGTAFFDRKESRDLLAYLKTCLQPQELPLRRILNTPARGLGEAAVDHIQQESCRHGLSFVKVVEKYEQLDFSPQHKHAFEEFWRSVHALKESLLHPVAGESPSQALIRWVQDSGYRVHLQRLAGSDQAFRARWMSVEILGRLLERYVEKAKNRASGLRDFLDSMDLRDTPEEGGHEDQVQLLTLHACKGLEFPVVLLCGVEEDLLPHKVLGSDLSEERRLFYVGITRAKEHLVLTRCQMRRKYGKLSPVAPSRFLNVLGEDLLHTHPPGGRISSPEKTQSKLQDLLAKLETGIQAQRLE